MDNSFDKRKAIAAARSLGYSEEVLDRIRKAKTESQCNHIFSAARKKSITENDHFIDKKIIEQRKKEKMVEKEKNEKSKKKMPHRVLCPVCGKDGARDYYLINVIRVKDGAPFYSKFQTLWCDECYTKLFKIVEKLNQAKGKLDI